MTGKNCKVKGYSRKGKKVKGHNRRMSAAEMKEYGTGEKKKAMKKRMGKDTDDGWWNDPDLQY